MLSAVRRSSGISASLGRRAASGIALKYSSAVFQAALTKSPQTLNKVQSELNTIATSMKETPALATFFTNPTLSPKDRASGLAGLYSKIEGTGAKKEAVSDVTKNMFSLLSENGRLAEVQGVIEGFNELVSEYKGELNVVITSATALDKPTLSKLESTLKQSKAAQEAKTLKVTNKVNPSVLGGIVVDFGEKSIDLSVASKVTKLNGLLQTAV